MKSFIALALLLSAPVFGAPAEARALAQSHHGCGLGRFALMPHHNRVRAAGARLFRVFVSPRPSKNGSGRSAQQHNNDE